MFPEYPDETDRNRCKKILIEFPTGTCNRGISRPPRMEGEDASRNARYGLFQEVDTVSDAGIAFQNWIADFDVKMHHVIFQHATLFKLEGRRPGVKPTVEDVGPRWKWSLRGRQSEPMPLYLRFQLEYEEKSAPPSDAVDPQSGEPAEPVCNIKLETAVFVAGSTEEEEPSPAANEDIGSITGKPCELTVLSVPRIWSSTMGYGITWTAKNIIIESAREAASDTVCLSQRASHKRAISELSHV